MVLGTLVVVVQDPLNVLKTNAVPSVVLSLFVGSRDLKTNLRAPVAGTLLTLRGCFPTHHQHRAVSVADDGVGDASHEGTSDPTETPAPHHYQANPQLLGQVYDSPVSVFLYQPDVGLRDLSPASSIFLTCSSSTCLLRCGSSSTTSCLSIW